MGIQNRRIKGDQKTTTDRKTMNKQNKNKHQECNLWYFSKFKLGIRIQKFKLGMGINGHITGSRPWRIPDVWMDVSVGWMVTRASNLSWRLVRSVRHNIDSLSFHAKDSRFFPEWTRISDADAEHTKRISRFVCTKKLSWTALRRTCMSCSDWSNGFSGLPC